MGEVKDQKDGVFIYETGIRRIEKIYEMGIRRYGKYMRGELLDH